MNKLLNISVICMLLIALVPIMASANSEDGQVTIDLIADGRDNPTDVGDVIVWNDGVSLYVKYVTTDGWCLLETHFHVFEDDLTFTDITLKNGNPPPGQFEYGEDDLGCVTEWEADPITLSWGIGDMLYIAAHAVVLDPVATESTFSLYDWGRSIEASESVPHSTEVGGAVIDGLALPIDEFQEEWNLDEYILMADPPDIDFASWPQWHGTCWNTYEVRHFQALLDLPEYVHPGYVDDVILYSPYYEGDVIPINDDIYVFLNGNDIGHKGTYYILYEGHTGGQDKPNYPETDGWWTTGNFGSGAAAYLQTGQNTIDIVAEEFCSWGGMDRLELKLIWHEQESAWAGVAGIDDLDGNGWGIDFPGKNWATYFGYSIQGVCPDVISYSGSLEFIDPPDAVGKDDLTSEDYIRVFSEGIHTVTGLPLDMLGTAESSPISGDYCSYYVHFDIGSGASETPKTLSGSIEFGADIVGLIYKGSNYGSELGNTLCDTNDDLGHPYVDYKISVCGQSGDMRGLEIGDPSDSVAIDGADGTLTTLTLTVQRLNYFDAFRIVLPLVP